MVGCTGAGLRGAPAAATMRALSAHQEFAMNPPRDTATDVSRRSAAGTLGLLACGTLSLTACAQTSPTSQPAASKETTMSPQRVATVQAIYQAFGRGDIAAIQGRVRPDTQWDFNGGRAEVPWHKPVKSRAEVAAFLGSFGSSNEVHRFEPREFIASGQHVIVEIHLEYTVRATGRRVLQDQLHWWSFDDQGQVARLRHFEDTAQVLAAVTAR
jgi:hypothetical protein